MSLTASREREWALLVPAYSIILMLLAYFTYWALAFSSTPAFNDLCTITGPSPGTLVYIRLICYCYRLFGTHSLARRTEPLSPAG